MSKELLNTSQNGSKNVFADAVLVQMLRASAFAPFANMLIFLSNYKEVSMIDHTGLNVSNPEKSRNFYNKALAPLGYTMMMEIPKEYTDGKVVLGYGVPPKADFWMSEGTPNKPHVHLAFRADTHAQEKQAKITILGKPAENHRQSDR